MTLTELEDDALDALGYNIATVDATVRSRIRRFINRWHATILSRPGFERLLRDHSLTFETEVSRQTYGLGIGSGRISGITCASQDMVLAQRDLSWLRQVDPGNKAIGGPAEAYIPIGWYPVLRQPTVTGVVTAVSDNAGDTMTITTEYVTASSSTTNVGDIVRVPAALTGLTPVAITTASCREIADISFSASPAGNITLTDAAAISLGVVQTQSNISTVAMHFQHIRLWPTPTAALTYTVDITRTLSPMTGSFERPILPEEFHYVLSLGAQVDEWRRKDDTRMDDVQAQLEQGLRSLNKWLWDTADYHAHYEVRPWARRSRLGSWFPAGS